MNPVVIRRLAVGAVCLVGVAAIYLWPTRASSPLGGPEAPATTGTNAGTETTSTDPTSPTTPGATSGPTGRPTSRATPYDPNRRVDTHPPRPPSSSEQSPGSSTGSASSPSTPGGPDTTTSSTPEPPGSTDGSGTSGPPSGPGSTTPSGSPTGPGTPGTPPPSDTEPPTAPTNLKPNPTYKSLTLSWDKSTGANPVTYQVYMDNVAIGDPTTETTTTVQWLIDDTHDGDTHDVWVRATDATGQHADSETITVTRPASEEGGGTRPPSDDPSSSTSPSGQQPPASSTPSRPQSSRGETAR